MPYRTIKEITHLTGTQDIPFVTTKHLLGAGAGAAPCFFLFRAVGGELWVFIGLGLGAALGIILTLDAGGLPLAVRLVYRMRGALARRLHAQAVRYDATPMAAHTGAVEPLLPVDEPVRVSPDDPRTDRAARQAVWQAVIGRQPGAEDAQHGSAPDPGPTGGA